MSTLFSLTVTDQSQMSKAVEVQTVHQALLIAAHDIRTTRAASGNFVVERGNVIGSWTYTGTATRDG